MYTIAKQWRFDAAHHLPGLPDGHKCARDHGHTYTVEVTLESQTLTGPGFVADFGDLAPLGHYLEAELDHRDLNQVLGFPPTAERIAQHIAAWYHEHLATTINARLTQVRVWETPTCFATYRPYQ